MPRLASLAHSGNYIIPYPHAFVTSKTYPDVTRLYRICPDDFALLLTPVLRFCALAAALCSCRQGHEHRKDETGGATLRSELHRWNVRLR